MQTTPFNPYIIAIAGQSCAGKTELAKAVASAVNAALLSMDSYYRDLSLIPPSKRARVNFDSPDALDHELLIEQVRRLSQGEAVQRPDYNFATHTRHPAGEHFVMPSDVLVVEGLFALYWQELRELAGTKIFVAASDEICFRRRKLRDVVERGRTAESVAAQYIETVQPMAARHITPTSKYADLVVSGQQALTRSIEEVLSHVLPRLRESRLRQATEVRAACCLGCVI